MSTSDYLRLLDEDEEQFDKKPQWRPKGVDYLGLAHKIAKRRLRPSSVLRQMGREQYVQFCNLCAKAFTELDPKFNARTFQEACKVVGDENPTYVGQPLPVESWKRAVEIAETNGQAVLVQIGKNVAKVFPQWIRVLRRPK